MRRINLLPLEERRRRAAAPRRGVVGILLIVGAVVVLVMVGVYVLYLVRLNTVEDQIAELDRQIAQQNARLAELSPYRDLQAQLEAKKPIADGIVRTRFAWDEYLQGLAFVIPDSTALDSMTATAAPINLDAPPEQPLSPPGAVTFTGVALPRYSNVSDFVVQMNTLRYLGNSTLNSAELDSETLAQPAITFEVASELITLVGESGTELRLDEGSPDEAPEEFPADQANAQSSASASASPSASASGSASASAFSSARPVGGDQYANQVGRQGGRRR